MILESVRFSPEVDGKNAEISKVYDYTQQLPKYTKKKAHCGVTGGFLYMSTGLCLRTSRSQVLALKKEPRIDCALVFFALGKVGGL